MEKKYELTNETITIGLITLHRIKALRSFNDVKKGDKGGFIVSEDNLSHEGNSWVYNEAKVYRNAKVLDNAIVRDYAVITGCAIISGNVIVKDKTYVTHKAKILDYAVIEDYAFISDKAVIRGFSTIRDKAFISGNAKIEGGIIGGNIEVCDDVTISKDVKIEGIGRFEGNAVISSNKDYIIFKNWWSSGRYFTWTRSNNMWSVGCFYGTGKELIEKAYKDSELSGREYERIVKYVESILNE